MTKLIKFKNSGKRNLKTGKDKIAIRAKYIGRATTWRSPTFSVPKKIIIKIEFE